MIFGRGLFLFFILFPTALAVAEGPAYSTYPVPPLNPNSLFYIQRSKNVNAIMYEANVTSDGTLNKDQPINIFWIRYTSDGSRAPLTFIQNKYAYGVKAEPFSKNDTSQYIVKFVSYDKRWIFVKRAPGGRFAAYMFINGSFAELNRVFIQIGQGSFWFPAIEYVELIGRDFKTQQPVSERFIPK